MKLSEWSLDKLLLYIGIGMLLVLFLPVGTYIVFKVSEWQEQTLEERGTTLAEILSRGLIDPLLVDDRLALHDILTKTAKADAAVCYLCIMDANGKLIAHTFSGGAPPALVRFLKEDHGSERVVRFRTGRGYLMNISVPVLTDELGTLHAGLSRAKALQVTHRLMWFVGVTLAGAILLLVAGARLVAARVSLPLRQLEEAVSHFPEKAPSGFAEHILGTREVESLAKGFGEMSNRLGLLERERAKTQERMVHTERLAALGELAAGLAHEIHNPLDGMKECLIYLEKDPDKNSRAVKYYPMLQEGLDRIARVMHEMLTLARSGQSVHPEPCELSKTFDPLALLVKSAIADRRVRVSWGNPDKHICLCDRQGLTQAILNLVLNAVEAAERSAELRVLVGVRSDSERIYVSVEDSGPGVPDELRDRIFDPFFTTKPAGKGTGLGLFVSRDLMRAVGGDIELSREAATLGGARFVISLPKVSRQEKKYG